ncbi:MAG: peptide-methionine (S)-S-oxide reductase [Desulfobacterales bacterium]|nr:peptide-methionine (S)-S-oxide reductase [Desulfobacterales bacterium]
MPDPFEWIGGTTLKIKQLDYDPRRVTYARLLDIFWESHRPNRGSWSRQYLNAVFYHNKEQHVQALASKAALEEKTGRTVKTEIIPLRSFTMAEDYHQKYTLKRHQDLLNEMTRIYPLPRDFVDSTAVTRLNGYAGRHGSGDQLTREIDSLGLTDGGKKRLAGLVR